MSNSLFVVPVDGSENSNRAVDYATELAKATGASLLIAHVISWGGFRPASALDMVEQPVDRKMEERYAFENILKPAQEQAEAAGVKAETWSDWGNPARLIQEEAKKRGAAMVIMGRSGHGSIAELVLGSVSNALIHHSDLPVVLVP